jgi:hypothetical protein
MKLVGYFGKLTDTPPCGMEMASVKGLKTVEGMNLWT